MTAEVEFPKGKPIFLERSKAKDKDIKRDKGLQDRDCAPKSHKEEKFPHTRKPNHSDRQGRDSEPVSATVKAQKAKREKTHYRNRCRISLLSQREAACKYPQSRELGSGVKVWAQIPGNVEVASLRHFSGGATSTQLSN